MTEVLFRKDAYLQEVTARVTSHTEEGGVVLDQTNFYATGGGQPGDSGQLTWGDHTLEIATTIKGQGDDIILVPAEPAEMPPVGAEVTQILNWERRHRMMRIHTALHLLSVVIPLPVSGGAISPEKGRLDFNMPEALENKEGLEAELNAIIAQNLAVTESWITDAELEASPDLVKTMSVKPPMGSGHIRLIRIGADDDQVDLQPCGGTHVARTGEIGEIRLGKVEKKGRENRRVNLHLIEV